jgi:hypothetical protein
MGWAGAGVGVAVGRHMLSDRENEVARVLARLLGFGMSQSYRIENKFRSVPLAFGFGVADLFLMAVEELKGLVEFLKSEHKAIAVTNDFIRKLDAEIVTLRNLMENNNN